MRELRSRIDSMLYERTALSKRPAKLIEENLRLKRLAKEALAVKVLGHSPRAPIGETGREFFPH